MKNISSQLSKKEIFISIKYINFHVSKYLIKKKYIYIYFTLYLNLIFKAKSFFFSNEVSNSFNVKKHNNLQVSSIENLHYVGAGVAFVFVTVYFLMVLIMDCRLPHNDNSYCFRFYLFIIEFAAFVTCILLLFLVYFINSFIEVHYLLYKHNSDFVV